MKFSIVGLKVTLFLGMLLAIGISTSVATVLSLHMGITIDPVNPRLDEVTVITVKVWEGQYAEVPELEVDFKSPSGIQLVDESSKITLALRGKELKECRFKVKYVSSPAEFGITARYRKVRGPSSWGGLIPGKLYVFKDDPRNPMQGLANGRGFVLYLYDKDKCFYSQSALQNLLHPDPAIVLQHELGLPEEGSEKGYWYSVAFHLNGDIEDFAKSEKMRREAVINLLKDKAKRLAKKKNISNEKAYEEILTRRLLWKDAGLPDLHEIWEKKDFEKHHEIR